MRATEMTIEIENQKNYLFPLNFIVIDKKCRENFFDFF